MASIRSRQRSDGSTGHAVLYAIEGRQTSVTFDTLEAAEQFRDMVDKVGARRAMLAWEIPDAPKANPNRGGPTLVEWLTQHVEHLTGCEQKTLDDYGRYTRQLKEFFGELPLAALTADDIARWIKHLEVEVGNSPKTIRNKHGFLSSALGKAVPTLIPSNPAAGRRLPRGLGDDDEMRMLTRAEFAALLEATTEYWRPLMEFLVVSGCRWGETVALKPGDIDRDACAVKIRRAWKHSSEGYKIGPPKTRRSRRTIKVPASTLAKLTYAPTDEWVFVNRDGGPVRYMGFRRRVWDKAVERSKLNPPPTPHDLRHTCASWMLTGGVPVTVVSRHLGHESIKITVDVYGDVDEQSAQLAADFMSGALSGAAGTPAAAPQPMPPGHPAAG
jgi:integrase